MPPYVVRKKKTHKTQLEQVKKKTTILLAAIFWWISDGLSRQLQSNYIKNIDKMCTRSAVLVTASPSKCPMLFYVENLVTLFIDH